jgi:hypothetical protein
LTVAEKLESQQQDEESNIEFDNPVGESDEEDVAPTSMEQEVKPKRSSKKDKQKGKSGKKKTAKK